MENLRVITSIISRKSRGWSFDGNGLEWLDFGATMYDPQVEKWEVAIPRAVMMPNLPVMKTTMINHHKKCHWCKPAAFAGLTEAGMSPKATVLSALFFS